ncbi:hypothetical protein [Streptomyces sp. ISL-10]|uniref:hypothetical protein n=1 Tax=Streptomyces sp. ISL-10 TaxID=2819172 RepID=UPI0020352E06|nr:hypothetical protein [Streptomyces sp. ISL-10]
MRAPSLRHVPPPPNPIGSAEHADYLVELSNIVRQRSIGPRASRSLSRLDLVLRALRELSRDPDVSVHLVADTHLLGAHREFADPQEVLRLRRWVAEGLVEEVPDADERILDLARMTGTRFVTGDRYVDHRVEHPWIQGNTTTVESTSSNRSSGRASSPSPPCAGVRLSRTVPVNTCCFWVTSTISRRSCPTGRVVTSAPPIRTVPRVGW